MYLIYINNVDQTERIL